VTTTRVLDPGLGWNAGGGLTHEVERGLRLGWREGAVTREICPSGGDTAGKRTANTHYWREDERFRTLRMSRVY